MTDQSVFPNTWVFRQALPSSSESSTRCHVSPISWCYTWHLEDASEEDGRAGWKAQVFGKTLLSFIKVKRSYCWEQSFNELFVYFFVLVCIYRITCWPQIGLFEFPLTLPSPLAFQGKNIDSISLSAAVLLLLCPCSSQTKVIQWFSIGCVSSGLGSGYRGTEAWERTDFCLYARAGVRMLLLTPSNVIANGKHMGKGKYWFLQKQVVFFFFFVLCVSVNMPVMQNDMFFIIRPLQMQPILIKLLLWQHPHPC